jgi:L-aspartate oxidase
MEATGSPHVLLDIRGIDQRGFPNVFAALREAGFDPARQPIPVAPAAHYLMGGIRVDSEGRTTLPGLLAVGECACSGLHGANRLASNSLSECFAFGSRAAATAARSGPQGRPPEPPSWRFAPPTARTRAAVWRAAGPRRREGELRALLEDPYPLARMIARGALRRRESRGAHVRVEHPRQDPEMDGHHIVQGPGDAVQLELWE